MLFPGVLSFRFTMCNNDSVLGNFPQVADLSKKSYLSIGSLLVKRNLEQALPIFYFTQLFYTIFWKQLPWTRKMLWGLPSTVTTYCSNVGVTPAVSVVFIGEKLSFLENMEYLLYTIPLWNWPGPSSNEIFYRTVQKQTKYTSQQITGTLWKKHSALDWGSWSFSIICLWATALAPVFKRKAVFCGWILCLQRWNILGTYHVSSAYWMHNQPERF